MRRGISVLLLGVALLLAGIALSYAQDVVSPLINEGEARMGSSLRFDSDGGDYRVITSGPSRPEIDGTGCTITTSKGRDVRVLGGEDVNASERLGVSRVLGFDVPKGPTVVDCSDRFIAASTRGRFQVVSADGPMSIAVNVAFTLGTLALIAAALMLVTAYRRRPDRAP